MRPSSGSLQDRAERAAGSGVASSQGRGGQTATDRAEARQQGVHGQGAMIQSQLFPQPVRGDARFSACGKIRWTLSRTWDDALPTALVIGNNPSNAGADKNDPTVLRWNHFFRAWGFGGYTAVNKYPWISADPRECWERAEGAIKGPAWGDRDDLFFVNLPLVVSNAKTADQVFVCWGKARNDDDHLFTEHLIEEIQTGEEPWPDLWCFGKNGDGSPRHPMSRGKSRVPDDQRPMMWRTVQP